VIGFDREPGEVLARLADLRKSDAPTHGGRVLSYVYDSGVPELDEVAAAAARAVQPVNGLDPTTFGSVAVMEREVLAFARRALGGDETVVGSVTSGGTESCLLAVKTARDAWRASGGRGRPRLVIASTAHAAFHKAAHLFDLELAIVPVRPSTGAPDAGDIADRLDEQVALVVASAPSYPFASLDPIEAIAAMALEREIDVHVDACIGGFALAFWPGTPLPAWDFRVPGVTSLSADLHKYGYAPKGVSVLLQRGRDRQRLQYFATTRWPGYPVVNPTLSGSKPAGPLAAAWAILSVLGEPGLRELTAEAARATDALRVAIDRIDGLRVVGEPVGPLLAVAVDAALPAGRRVDPHRWADAARARGWQLQLQPGMVQADGSRLPHTTHLTVTPVTEQRLPELVRDLTAAAGDVRGMPRVETSAVLGRFATSIGGPEALAGLAERLDADTAAALLAGAGLGGSEAGPLPAALADVLALVEALPPTITERLLVELLARLVEPVA
jgi:sphinganine-1-phosphate aldolase